MNSIRIVQLLLFTFYTGLLFGQFSQPYFRKIGKNEGLTGSLVLSMVQDSRNLYWIGTLNGLQSFDGKIFKKYPLPFFQNGIPGSNSVSCLLVANDSILWVTHYQGIAKFNLYTHTFEYIQVPKESLTQTLTFSSVFEDKEENIWASSLEAGLIKYMPEKKCFEKAGDDRFRLLNGVKGALPVGKEQLLVFHKEGCGIFDVKKNKLVEAKAVPPDFKWINKDCFQAEIYDLFNDVANVYALTWNFDKVGYDFIRFSKKGFTHETCNIKSVTGRSFFKDSQNNIWLYGDGLDVILAGSEDIISIKENVKEGKFFDFTMCYGMFEDKEHNVWICTNAGLFVFNINDPNFMICNDTKNDEFVKHTYNCLNELTDETIWAGTFGEGLLILDANLKQKSVIDFKKKTNDQHYNLLWSIHETKDKKEIWLGCQRGRLICYDCNTKKFKFYKDTAFDQKTILCITEDDEGNLFFGTYGGYVIRKIKKENSFTRLYEPKQSESQAAAGFITSLFCSANDILIGTSSNGIIRVDLRNGETENITDINSLKSNNIFCLLPIETKGYFAGTSNGLGYFDFREKNFYFFTLFDGLPFSNVYSLENIGNNNMIAMTSDGLYRINWNFKSFESISRITNLYKDFNVMYLKKNGKDLLLADDEYLYNLPLIDEQKRELPVSFIYSISSFNESFFLKGGHQPVKFDRDHNTINIEFGTSTFKYYNSIDYYYKLEGIDDEWLPAGSNRVVTYNKLKGGEYIFRLKCIFQENKNSTQELEMGFSIAKPFNQTIWFYLLILMLVSTIFYLAYRVRFNKLLAIEKIRFGLSKDLHDDMGSILSTINILSVMAEKKIYEDTSTSKEYLKRINGISQEMMESMDDIIWSINPINDTMERVVVRMREFAAGILEPLNISLLFEVDNVENALEMKMKWRRDFFLVFKEAINNSAKYSKCENIKVQMSMSGKNLYLCISDDGIGFNTEEINAGNGLLNMKKRVKDIGGILRIKSATNVGTRISLLIPLNRR